MVQFYGLTLLRSYALTLLLSLPCIAQNATHYQMETIGSASTGRYTPFWIVSNTYGTIPLDAGNALLRTSLFHHQSLRKGFHWSAGLDMLAVTPRYRHLYVQQLYAALQYKSLTLTVGSRENYASLWDKELSSGDLVHSPNARPIPEINLSVPKFTTVPFTYKILQFRGDVALGRSFDSQYLKSFANENAIYIKDVLWHHKSLQLRFLDPEKRFPLTVVAGMRHHAQWGGTSTDPAFGKQPRSFKDLVRILFGKSGGDNASEMDQINVLGNHYGSYELQFGYLSNAFDVHIYAQHFFEDVSGMELYNFPDGLWGLQVDIPNVTGVNKIVLEYLDTRNQSGPVHWLWYDRDVYPGHGGGRDEYYNNEEYTTGLSYFNRSIGSPLLPSPEYNDNHDLGFKSNRISAFHVGFQGYLSKQVSYRLLSTYSNGWGTHPKPFLKKKTNASCAIKISYCHPRLADWFFSGEAATDNGSMFGNTTGLSISIKKTGILKNWK